MLKRYDELARASIRAEIAALEPDTEGHIEGDLLTLVRSALSPIAGQIAGLDGITTPEESAKARAMAERVTKASLYRWTELTDSILREVADTTKAAFFEQYFADSLQRRKLLVDQVERGEISADDLPLDLITMHLTQPGRFNWEVDPDELLLREVLLFFGGTGSTITILMPPVVAQIAQWFEQHPEDRSRLLEADFLRQACTESMRLHPSGQVLTRIAKEDVVLRTGRKISKGEVCACDAAAAGRDPSVFSEDADQFRLPRDYPPTSPEGLAFGGGPHLCIGMGMTLGTGGADGSVGTMVVMLMELYAAGMVMSPENAPEMKPPVIDSDEAYEIRNYLTFPVRFEKARPDLAEVSDVGY